MNTIELAKLLMQRLGWNYEDLAGELGISRQVAHRTINNPIKTRRRDNFHLGVIYTAFKHGFESEALSVILRCKRTKEVTSALRAVILYPDLKPNELEQIIKIEEETKTSPLPAKTIRSIVKKFR